MMQSVAKLLKQSWMLLYLLFSAVMDIDFALDVLDQSINLPFVKLQKFGLKSVQMIQKLQIGLRQIPKNVPSVNLRLKRMADVII
jgi:hypothetical protein